MKIYVLIRFGDRERR